MGSWNAGSIATMEGAPDNFLAASFVADQWQVRQLSKHKSCNFPHLLSSTSPSCFSNSLNNGLGEDRRYPGQSGTACESDTFLVERTTRGTCTTATSCKGKQVQMRRPNEETPRKGGSLRTPQESYSPTNNMEPQRGYISQKEFPLHMVVFGWFLPLAVGGNLKVDPALLQTWVFNQQQVSRLWPWSLWDDHPSYTSSSHR